jgi:hypothetical protein
MTGIELAERLTILYGGLGPLPVSDVGMLMEELDALNGWLAESSQLVAEAQAMYDKERGDVAESLAGRADLSASMMRLKIDGQASEQKRLLMLADRLNATLVHRIDSVRTLLSFEKMLATQSGYQPRTHS